MFKIKDIMSKEVFTIDSNETVINAAKLMKKKGVGCLVVIEDKKAIGIITERDVTEKFVGDGMNPLTKVRDIMSTPVYTTEPERDAVGIAFVTEKLKIKKIPVMDKGRLIGIVTDTDLLAAFTKELDVLKNKLSKDKIDITEYNKRSLELVESISQSFKDIKMWHMICLDCKKRFYSEEHDGVLINHNCPFCKSFNIDYDRGGL